MSQWEDKDLELQAKMEGFVEDGPLDDNIESFSSHDDTDPIDAAVLWYTDTLKPKSTLEEHSGLITDVRFSPSMSHLATSSFDKTVRVWDADSPGYSIRTYMGHSGNDDLICSCDGDGEIRFWSINNRSCTRAFKVLILFPLCGSGWYGPWYLRFQPRLGKYLAAAAENVVSILDTETQTCRHSLQGHTKPIHFVCWDPSGELLASVSADSVRVWSFASGSEGECVHELSCNGNKFLSCVFHPSQGFIAALAVSPVTRLVSSASHDKFVKLWK
ncbi:hypothetical protein ES332_D13G251500v1 [Gossypium tomentosum]|uniref:Uncharacterized protein n=1 Tax=Gossypium tomentosum TaxID=34277 RepID=A0A5D2I1V7_GOSTO|nr:hypothetical protein ES332_D13G251500v1 [Gossypium tomentosum]